MENWKIKIIDQPYNLSKSIYIFRDFNGEIVVMNSDNTETRYQKGQAIPDKPTISLDSHALQVLTDALSEMGIKPQKGFLEGKLEGTEKHLEDMRKLVFKLK